MLPLSPIPDSVDVVFHDCIDTVDDDNLRTKLRGIKASIIEHDTDFVKAAKAARFFTLPTHDMVGGTVTAKEMAWVYDKRMVPANTPGRMYYNKIMALAKHRRCPLCGHGSVTTLDHYLPKSEFPGLAVSPKNLLPSCSDCNKRKLAAVPSCASQQTINPYYDRVDGEIWLHAKCEKQTPLVFKYFVVKPKLWPTMQERRVRHHFKAFNLAQMYAEQAALEFEDIKSNLIDILNKCGPNDVRSHLSEQADSRTKASKNSWRAAFYRAISASNWFCTTGCKG